MTKRRLRDFSPRVRILFIALAAVQLSLNLAAQRDLTRRSPSEVRGSKIAWRLVSLINIFGPLAYFRWGRLPRQEHAQ